MPKKKQLRIVEEDKEKIIKGRSEVFSLKGEYDERKNFNRFKRSNEKSR